MSLANIMTLIIITCHWLACVWGLQASFMPLDSWYYGSGYCDHWGDANETRAIEMLTDGSCPLERDCEIGMCENGVCEGGTACVYPGLMYTAALYFSIMTITSVGYSSNFARRLACSCAYNLARIDAATGPIASSVMLSSALCGGLFVGV